MKKTKVVIPALGIIAFATAASITGTVAWFTSSRTATISTTDFAVVKTDGALDVSCEYGVGTAITNDLESKPTVVNPVTNAKIGDISFDPANKQLWNDTGAGTAFRKIGDTDDYADQPDTNGAGSHPWKINETTYHAFTWKVKLQVEWGADKTAYNLFFDYKSSTMTASSQASGNYVTAKGFRIAFISQDGSHVAVWSDTTDVARAAVNLNPGEGVGQDDDTDDPGEAASTMSAVTEVSTVGTVREYGVSPLNSGFSYFGADKYAAASVAPSSATKTKVGFVKAVDGEANQNLREDYLGQIAYSTTLNTTDGGAHNHAYIYCVAWYEGTDAAVVNDVDLAKVKSTIHFYTALNA